MGKIHAGSSFSNIKQVNWRVRWDMSNYPYASIDTQAEDNKMKLSVALSET